MRFANLDDRLVLIVSDTTAVDVESASEGRFSSDPQSAYDQWDEFVAWAATVDAASGTQFDPAKLGAPVPRPQQVFAIGLNYASHAAETGASMPPAPNTFTKFPTCLVGPNADIELVRDHWGAIENGVHWVRDVTLDEDRCPVCRGHAPQNLAAFRNAALNWLRRIGADNFAAKLCSFTRNSQRLFAMFGSVN